MDHEYSQSGGERGAGMFVMKLLIGCCYSHATESSLILRSSHLADTVQTSHSLPET